MVPIRFQTILALSAFLLMAVLADPLLAAPLIPRQAILDVLYKNEILPPAERDRLQSFADQLSASDYSLKEFEELALAVSNKVKRDLKNLSNLSYYLQEMVENQYAQKAGDIKERSTLKLQKSLAALDKDSQGVYQYRVLEEYKPSKIEFVKIIKHDIRLLVGAQDITASKDVWKEVREGFARPYKKWNERFHELETSHLEDNSIVETYGNPVKKKFYEKPTRSSKEYIQQRSHYDVEELEFMNDFVRAQGILRRLSNTNSWDF